MSKQRMSGGAVKVGGAPSKSKAPDKPDAVAGKSPGEALGVKADYNPTRPRTFDLRSFISGATQQPFQVVPVTSRPVEAAEAERIDDQIRTLEEHAPSEEPEGKRLRMGERSPRDKMLQDLRARYEELVPVIADSWAKVRLRPIEPHEQDQVRLTVREHNIKPGVGQAAVVYSIVALIGPPEAPDEDGDDELWSPMEREEWEALLNAIGPVQYNTLDAAYEMLSYAQVTPDFYGRFSASRTTPSSS